MNSLLQLCACVAQEEIMTNPASTLMHDFKTRLEWKGELGIAEEIGLVSNPCVSMSGRAIKNKITV